jgi:hypothetical protein
MGVLGEHVYPGSVNRLLATRKMILDLFMILDGGGRIRYDSDLDSYFFPFKGLADQAQPVPFSYPPRPFCDYLLSNFAGDMRCDMSP